LIARGILGTDPIKRSVPFHSCIPNIYQSES
jgi:hypothetical protein